MKVTIIVNSAAHSNEGMNSRVVFTRDFSGESDSEYQDKSLGTTTESRKLYTRIRITNADPTLKRNLSDEVQDKSDPVLSYMRGGLAKHEVTDNESFDNWGNIIIWVDILAPKNEDFVQYQGHIDGHLIRKVTEDGIAKGIGLGQMHVWIYGLLMDGKYDGSNYEFGLVKVDERLFWSIRILHLGLFKMLFKVELTENSTIDIDEFFVEDLERFYKESIEHRKKEEKWKLEKTRYMHQINLLNDKKEIGKLGNSVRLMKNRITNYFLPLVNSLLEDKRELVEKMDGKDDTFFTSTRKRKTDNLDNDMKGVKMEEEVQQGKKMNDDDEDLDWMQRERNKRMKLLNYTPKMIAETSEPRPLENSHVSSTTDDSLVFNKRGRSFRPDTQQDTSEATANSGKKETSRDSSVILEEETQADEATDVSQEKNIDLTDTSGEVTEISDS